MKILICTLLWCCTKGDAFQEFSYARFARQGMNFENLHMQWGVQQEMQFPEFANVDISAMLCTTSQLWKIDLFMQIMTNHMKQASFEGPLKFEGAESLSESKFKTIVIVIGRRSIRVFTESQAWSRRQSCCWQDCHHHHPHREGEKVMMFSEPSKPSFVFFYHRNKKRVFFCIQNWNAQTLIITNWPKTYFGFFCWTLIYTLTEEAASSCPSFPLLLQSFSHAATISSDKKSGLFSWLSLLLQIFCNWSNESVAAGDPFS